VLIDEFGSSLDETSALTLAASLSRRAARSGVRVVCAGVRGDIAAALRARVVALVKLSGEIEVMARGARGGRNDAERAA
jgi:ABC-type ATPase with predicted acetyltransferase domain